MEQSGGRAAIYARISRDDRHDSDGVTAQKKRCRDLADRLGLQVVQVITDNDVSAVKARAGWDDLLAGMSDGTFTHVIADNPERFQRDNATYRLFENLVVSSRVQIELVSGYMRLDSAQARYASRAQALGAEFVREDIQEKVRKKHRWLAEQGKPTGGPRSFGYDDDRVTVRESEAEVVRELARRILAGESIHRLCEELNERGVTTAYGNPWRVTAMRRTMVSPRLAGFREHQGDRFKAVWPAILDRRTHDRLVRHFEGGTRRPAARSYRLSGLLWCPQCQRGMVGKASNGQAAYTCAPSNGGCGRTAKAEPVEEYLENLTERQLAKGSELSERVAARRSGDASEAHARVEALDADLEALAADHGSGALSRAEWLAARRPLAARAEAARADLKRSETAGGEGLTSATLATWRKGWAGSEEVRTAAIRGLLERVEVGPGMPGRAFRSERFAPVWAV